MKFGLPATASDEDAAVATASPA
eukprot:COSAG02_NODE_64844_length_259_cov_0.956250_1_plen_22_part_10